MPRIDLDAIASSNATGYPEPYCRDVANRSYKRMTKAAGLSDFGVNHVTLAPGAWSSQRHWHVGEDEFLVMLAGEAVLVEEGQETVLRPGDCAAFPKGVENGHHLINRSDRPCVFVCVGRNSGTDCHYPDIDLICEGPSGRYLHRDRSPY